ncbi:TetR/AcrR family transcriptional regulator [Rathayibacter sp. YIM 133350]|uniref:TetR/AcrR family transcriptional regulator n=1 Tax=Rathayibacter sp. YIM 133350 TaxID=3131992 RepID=UPI00307F03B8
MSTLSTIDVPASTLVRTEPVQQRSADRLNSLLDAAAVVVDEIGFDRMTTAMIAERSGASIGTVYRYFPDRIAVLQALRERATERFRARAEELMRTEEPATLWEGVDCGITAYVELYRTEPGFRIIHFVDSERMPLSAAESEPKLAKRFASVFRELFEIPGEDLDFRIEITIEIADSLLSRAFAWDRTGDELYIAECRRILHGYLESYYGELTS